MEGMDSDTQLALVLHKHCKQKGSRVIQKIKELFNSCDERQREFILNLRWGFFGHTALHVAAVNDNPNIIRILIELGANVNVRALNGYTPLHLAVSSGYVDCVKELLECGADITLKDDSMGWTPKQTAEISSKPIIVRLLRSEEIIHAIETDACNVTDLLRIRSDELEHTCFDRALIAAVKKGNHLNIGKLVVKGASNIDDALKLSAKLRMHNARAMLLLIKAAHLNDTHLVLSLFGASEDSPLITADDPDFAEVQKAVMSGIVSTVVPIEIARRHGNSAVREELLLRTDVNQEDGSVHWHGLRLVHLDLSWIKKIYWVKKLRLARNGFRTIPNEVGEYLRQVRKLDLQHNELVSIPGCLLNLPFLNELILSSNRLKELPNIYNWAPGLSTVDLSNNELTNLPEEVKASSLTTLLLANNRLSLLPSCIYTFLSLQHLDISDNPDISTLPVEMGRLSNLSKLVIKGLKLKDPPQRVQSDARSCIRYLKNKLQASQKCFRMKLNIVGSENTGKTTLVQRLKGVQPQNTFPTVGINVEMWENVGGFIKRKYEFNIWDFGGNHENFVISPLFFTQQSMYLLLWNVKHGEKGIAELKPWLDNISLRAPRSCVLIVGTHLDEVEDSERPKIDILLNKVGELAEKYPKLQISEVLAVGLMNRLENIGTLRDAIYDHATRYKGKGSVPVMGQEIPASYFILKKQLEKFQEEVRKGSKEPVIHAEEFKDLVQQLKLLDICNDDELRTATLFLNEMGTILHYDDRSHNLNELYFIDPHWLYDITSNFISCKRNPFIKDGILHSSDIPALFKNRSFPWNYFEPYLILLHHFEIALPLDNRRIFIPSMLPEERPAEANLPDDPYGPYYQRYFVIQSPCLPRFWSRLISHIMHIVPEIKTFTNAYETEVSAISIVHDVKCTSPMANCEEFVLPNIQKSLFNAGESTADDETKIVYWMDGFVYKSPSLCFGVESFERSHIYANGIVVMVSPSLTGKRTICLLVDLIDALIHNWYPEMYDFTCSGIKGVQQKVPCYECLKLKLSQPFEFDVDNCTSKIQMFSSDLKIECHFDTKNPLNNHTVPLADVIPDILLEDLGKKFFLKAEDLNFQEDKDSFLGEGMFGKIYCGKFQGNSVNIKTFYFRKDNYNLNDLRSMAILLQKIRHSFIVEFLGVITGSPKVALIFAEAPLGTLGYHLMEKNTSIERVVVFRIAIQVASALKYLHQRGIIFRDVKAKNVLMWSFDVKAKCNCKLSGFEVASRQLDPIGAVGIYGNKGFIAPEVLFIGRRKAVYNHKVDIYLFSMLLYQMIARRHPFYNIQLSQIDTKVINGERPTTIDVHLADTGYYYLTKLMERCWNDRPDKRPDADEIIEILLDRKIVTVMGVRPIYSRFSLRQGCAVTTQDFAKANVDHAQSSELWICCDGAEGAELHIITTNQMVKISKNFIKDNQVQCMCVCGDHVWVCSRSGIDFGVIDIYNNISHELVHNIRMKENAVCCITTSDDVVYVGTLEGYVFAFTMDLKMIQANQRPRHQYLCENPIDGIAVTSKHVWVSHTKSLLLLDLQTLKMECELTQDQHNDGSFIGSLTYSKDTGIVLSAHLGGTILSAWNADMETHMYDIDTQKVLIANVKNRDFEDRDAIMTCMTPILDTVWVGMATGHIMIFQEKELLYFVRPYREYVRFLIPVPCEGPTGKEKGMVVSGAKGFTSPKYFCNDPTLIQCDKELPRSIQGTLILWEACDSEFFKLELL